MLDTSNQTLGDSTPKRPTLADLGAPPSAKMKESSRPIATFPQASSGVVLPDETMPISHLYPTTPVPETPRAASIPATPPSNTSPEDDTGTLPEEVMHLQGEMNRIMGWLLMTRASMDTHWRKEVSNFQMALHQNEAITTEAIREAEALHAAAVREAKACCANIIHDAHTTCARTIRKVETACREHACALQQAQRDSMEGLEREAIEEEEEQGCQSFLTTCGVALQICPQEPMGY